MFYKYGAVNKDKKQQVERERELIKKIQLYNDKAAMKELMRDYGGGINSQITNSGILGITDKDTATSVAEKFFKQIVKDKYDLSMPNQPNTFILGNLNNELLKYKDQNSEGISRRPQDDSRINRLDQVSQNWLSSMDMDTSPEASAKFMKSELKRGGERAIAKNIEKTRAMERRELSGDKGIGGEGTEGVDFMSFSEMFAPQSDKGDEEVFNDFFKKQQIQETIKQPDFSRAERVYITQLAGIGEYKNKPQVNKNQAALNAGISYAQGVSAIQKLKKKLGIF